MEYPYYGKIHSYRKEWRSDQISGSVVTDSLRPHESQHARPPCPSPTHRVHWDSRPLSQWCHPAISSSCRPLLLLPPIPPSIRVFSSESTLRMRWPKYWSFSFSIIPSREIPGLISFRMDWLDLSCGHMLSHKELHSVALPSIRACDFYLEDLFGFDFNLITEFIFSSHRFSGLEGPLKLSSLFLWFKKPVPGDCDISKHGWGTVGIRHLVSFYEINVFLIRGILSIYWNKITLCIISLPKNACFYLIKG